MDQLKHQKIISTIMQALLELKQLSGKDNGLSNIIMFLITIISTTADLMELEYPGVVTSYIYTEIEAAMKIGGLRAVRDFQIKHGSINYSVSDIGENDMEKAMNYVGQELGVTLFKVVHEIPLPLRGKEILLRGIEALLGNVLYGKFKEDDPHKLMDLISEHVHTGLKNLETKIKQFPSKNLQK